MVRWSIFDPSKMGNSSDIVEAFADSKLYNVSRVGPSQPRVEAIVTHQLQHGKMIHKLPHILAAGGRSLVETHCQVIKSGIVPEEVQGRKHPSSMVDWQGQYLFIDGIPQVLAVPKSTAKKYTESATIEHGVGLRIGEVTPRGSRNLKSRKSYLHG